MKTETLITSSGVIRNRSLPRTGIINASNLYDELFEDCLSHGIDLTWEYFQNETMTRLMNDNPDLDDFAIAELFDKEAEYAEFDSREFLLGAWVKDSKGHYRIDKSGDKGNYALTYDSSSGYVCVEWSQLTKPCNNTSPCFVMADGSGPCGDLDSEGDSVIAYALPQDMLETLNN